MPEPILTYRCARCHRPMGSPRTGPTECACGGTIQIAPRETRMVDWPCKKCSTMPVEERSISDVFDDYEYRCPGCGHTWIEEGADA